ncbi:MAG: hypothetical protein VW362_11910, partial [Candidatus Nanopelagicales bacterium]
EAEAFWDTVRKIAPKAKCVQLLGNHDERPFSRLIEQAPMLESIVADGIMGLYSFRGVETWRSFRDPYVVDGIAFMHGFGKHGTHARACGMPVVRAHTHQPGLAMIQSAGDVLWELDVGYCADPESAVFGYTKTSWLRWRRALGVIDNGSPRLIFDS